MTTPPMTPMAPMPTQQLDLWVDQPGVASATFLRLRHGDRRSILGPLVAGVGPDAPLRWLSIDSSATQVADFIRTGTLRVSDLEQTNGEAGVAKLIERNRQAKGVCASSANAAMLARADLWWCCYAQARPIGVRIRAALEVHQAPEGLTLDEGEALHQHAASMLQGELRRAINWVLDALPTEPGHLLIERPNLPIVCAWKLLLQATTASAQRNIRQFLRTEGVNLIRLAASELDLGVCIREQLLSGGSLPRLFRAKGLIWGLHAAFNRTAIFDELLANTFEYERLLRIAARRAGTHPIHTADHANYILEFCSLARSFGIHDDREVWHVLEYSGHRSSPRHLFAEANKVTTQLGSRGVAISLVQALKIIVERQDSDTFTASDLCEEDLINIAARCKGIEANVLELIQAHFSDDPKIGWADSSWCAVPAATLPALEVLGTRLGNCLAHSRHAITYLLQAVVFELRHADDPVAAVALTLDKEDGSIHIQDFRGPKNSRPTKEMRKACHAFIKVMSNDPVLRDRLMDWYRHGREFWEALALRRVSS